MREEKRNVIVQLIEMYDIRAAANIQDMLEAELDQQMEAREEAEPEFAAQPEPSI